MFGATPPRRISRSSTRKDTESLSSCSTTSESANFPLKVIRWSVAIEPAIRSAPAGPFGMTRKTTHGYVSGYPPVAPSVAVMTAPRPTTTLAYDDLATPQEMHADCRATGDHLRLQQAARAAVAPAPSIHFEDFPREVRKREITVSEAATRLANALHLHLD